MNNDAFKAKRKDLYASVTEQMETGVSPVYETWANQLLKGRAPGEVLGALLFHCFDAELSSDDQGEKKSDKAQDSTDAVRLFVGLGKKDGLTVRSLINMVLEKMPITAKKITNIHILETFAFMTMPAAKAAQLVACYEGRGGGPPLITYEEKGKGPKGDIQVEEEAPPKKTSVEAIDPWAAAKTTED